MRTAYPEISLRFAKGYIGSDVAVRRVAQGFVTTIAANAWGYTSTTSHNTVPARFVLITYRLYPVQTKCLEASFPRVYDDFVKLLKEKAVHETVIENLDTTVRKSLKSPADERRERLAIANRQPQQVVVLTFGRNPDAIAEVIVRAGGDV
ncbi:hypothetical protein [Pandoraea anhela]|uniref:hypothetical protein n=1 Tax=Pandoraea anhela TaxID=2508295 RepID=UPI001241684E|nr:hypothetical protein [Pandoraea anhela]